jgi:hypothetical protein
LCIIFNLDFDSTSIRVTNDETPEMSDADLVALKKAAPLIKEMLIAVDKELYARAEVGTVVNCS